MPDFPYAHHARSLPTQELRDRFARLARYNHAPDAARLCSIVAHRQRSPGLQS